MLHDKRNIVLLPEEMPDKWYNIAADLGGKLLPPLHPGTLKPIDGDSMSVLFADELIKQEMSTERFINIPDEVRELYGMFRPTPLYRAVNLEKMLGTPAKIYYKYEGVSPAGSHKTNTAIPQAFYNKLEGVKKIATETGAGQWGSALAFACNHFGIDLQVFMVKVSFNQKPYRKMLMNLWNASVEASPSIITQAGRNILAEFPDSPGSLGIAISEAIEIAVSDPKTKYSLGSVLNHVLLHQTIIGLEAEKQMEKAGDYPDVVIGCLGGGSNFAGISFPFIRYNLDGKRNSRFIAVEPSSCPKLTKGKFRYDFGDVAGMTPLLPMHTLGHNFIPPGIHAGGLRYHGASPLVSALVNEGIVEAQALDQLECFEAGLKFAQAEGILPAPETSHAVAWTIREALKAKTENTPKTILFNMSGHGYFDMYAYQQYLDNKLANFVFDDDILKNIEGQTHPVELAFQ